MTKFRMQCAVGSHSKRCNVNLTNLRQTFFVWNYVSDTSTFSSSRTLQYRVMAYPPPRGLGHCTASDVTGKYCKEHEKRSKCELKLGSDIKNKLNCPFHNKLSTHYHGSHFKRTAILWSSVKIHNVLNVFLSALSGTDQ